MLKVQILTHFPLRRAALFRIGTSQNCVSLYGIQDLIGNFTEWVSDQTGICVTAGPYSCPPVPHSALDVNNTDWSTLIWDGTVAPGRAVDPQNWTLPQKLFSATEFPAPLGVPLVTGVASSFDSLEIGTGKTPTASLTNLSVPA